MRANAIPPGRRAPVRRTSFGATAIALALLGALAPVGAAAADPPVDVRLRIQWTRPAPARVHGEIRVDEGRLSVVENLSLDASTTGAFWLESDLRTLRVAPRGAIASGGVEVRYQGPSEGQLTVSLAAGDAAGREDSPAEEIAFAIPRVADGPRVAGWGSDGGRIWVRRRPGDALRLDFDQSHMIFAPGEPLAVRAALDALLAASVPERARFFLELREARGGPVRWRGDVPWGGRGGEVDLGPVPLPADEGVYDLSVSLSPAAKLVPLKQPQPIAETTVQLVAFARRAAADDGDAPGAPVPSADDGRDEDAAWQEIDRVEPGETKWWDHRWLPSTLPSLVGRAEQPLVSGPLVRERVGDREVAIIAPGGWHAYPLKIEHPGRPHRLVVRAPGDRHGRIGISIIERDAAGRIAPMGIDSGMAIEPSAAVADPHQAEHRVVFWPKTDVPYVVLANHSAIEPAWFEDVVIETRAEPLSSPSHASEAVADADGDADGPAAGASRLAALYLDRPILVDAFGATRAADEEGRTARDDWVSFLEAGQRLVEYLEYAGYNGAILTVGGEGGALYPTEALAATARFDTGTFFANGRDPRRKDVLELLFRLFDRRGLRLVPALELATPLPELERLLAADDDRAVGIVSVDSNGRPHRDDAGVPDAPRSLAGYNPLDPRVQVAVERQLAELARRYGEHPSWGGIGVHIDAPSYLTLSGASAGRDARTLGRFANSLPGQPPEGEALVRLVDGGGHGAFLQWRGERLAEFYGRLAGATGDGPLYLLQANRDARAGDATALGLDWEAILRQTNLVALAVARDRPMASPLARHRQSVADEETAPAERNRGAGILLFTPPETLHLPGLETRNPWDADRIRVRLFSQGSVAGRAARRRLARAVVEHDRPTLAIGGWTPPLGQEHETRRWLRRWAALPEEPFEGVPMDGERVLSSVVVRQLQRDEGRYVYAVNPEAWPVRLDVRFDRAAAPRPLSAAETGDALAAGRWQPLLEPGGLRAIFIPALGEGERLSWQAAAAEGPALENRLRGRLEDLGRRVASVDGRPLDPPLVNGGFEQPVDEGTIPGWLRAQHPADCVSVDTQSAAEGERSIRLEGHPGGVRTWLLSAPLAAPETGRLLVAARVRVRRTSSAPVELRMAIEGRYRGTAFRRSVLIGAPEAGPPPRTDWSGAPYRLEITDLPIQGIEELRVAFDVLSPGTVWIDDVRVSDLFLTDGERSDLQSRMFVAVERLRRGESVSAGELLDSYWGRYLMQQPLTVEATAKPPSPPRPASTAERIRGWLPRRLRF